LQACIVALQYPPSLQALQQARSSAPLVLPFVLPTFEMPLVLPLLLPLFWLPAAAYRVGLGDALCGRVRPPHGTAVLLHIFIQSARRSFRTRHVPAWARSPNKPSPRAACMQPACRGAAPEELHQTRSRTVHVAVGGGAGGRRRGGRGRAAAGRGRRRPGRLGGSHCEAHAWHAAGAAGAGRPCASVSHRDEDLCVHTDSV